MPVDPTDSELASERKKQAEAEADARKRDPGAMGRVDAEALATGKDPADIPGTWQNEARARAQFSEAQREAIRRDPGAMGRTDAEALATGKDPSITPGTWQYESRMRAEYAAAQRESIRRDPSAMGRTDAGQIAQARTAPPPPSRPVQAPIPIRSKPSQTSSSPIDIPLPNDFAAKHGYNPFPPRWERWLSAARSAIVAAQPMSGRNTAVDVHPGKGTVINIFDTASRGGPHGTGACCVGTDCSIQTAAACTGMGGTYQGDGTPCDPNPCSPTGACCFDDGTCDDLTESDCNDAGGNWQGAGTACSDDPPRCLGVCCEDSGCVDNSTPDSCAADGGTWTDFGTTCADDPPPCPATGACCVGSDCSIQTESDCTGMDGMYQGDDTTCDPNPCLTGACCADDNSCSIETESDCTDAGGTYQGDDTTCDPNPCGEVLPNCPCYFLNDGVAYMQKNIESSGSSDDGMGDTGSYTCNTFLEYDEDCNLTHLCSGSGENTFESYTWGDGSIDICGWNIGDNDFVYPLRVCEFSDAECNCGFPGLSHCTDNCTGHQPCGTISTFADWEITVTYSVPCNPV